MNISKIAEATGGEWEADTFGEETFVLTHDAEGETVYLAEIVHADEEGRFETEPEVRQANARLMAAAPDMYAALKALDSIRPVNWEDNDDDEQVTAWIFLDQVIAKAEGR